MNSLTPKPRYPSSEQLSRYTEAARQARQAARHLKGVNGDLSFDLYRLAREAQAEADRIEQELTGCLAEIATPSTCRDFGGAAEAHAQRTVGEIQQQFGTQ